MPKRTKEIIVKHPYKVMIWDVNQDRLEWYDVIDFFLEEYYDLPKKKRPIEYEDIKKFILAKGHYQYWARCEYEIIISDWPNQRHEVKIDVFDQIEANIEVVTKTFIENL